MERQTQSSMEIRMKTSLFGLIVMSLAAVAAHAQGTIAFYNSTLSKLLFCENGVAVPCPVGVVVGVFWGEENTEPFTLVTPTVTVTTPGIFNGGVVYPISGTAPGQRVNLVIAAWYNRTGPTPAQIQRRGAAANITDYGESRMVTVALGPSGGPGTVVWQGATGTD